MQDARQRLLEAQKLLREGRFAEAWPLYEARREYLPETLPQISTTTPEWTGQALAGRRIVVFGEGGLGDQIMFGRFIPQLRAEASEVVMCVNNQVAPLYRATGLATYRLTQSNQLPEPADYWCFLGSLPLLLRTSEPPPAQYLPFRAEGTGIGVMTRGNPASGFDEHRSLSPSAAREVERLGLNLHPEATGYVDFLQTARAMREMDLIITVDTSVAHLAGAMGAQVWLMLPRNGLCWRYGDGVTSRWYPEATLFRQAAPDDWAPVAEAVRAALTHRYQSA